MVDRGVGGGARCVEAVCGNTLKKTAEPETAYALPMHRAMKWLIPTALCTVVTAGWYILPTLTVRKPRRYLVQIESGGGPLDFDIVFWPNDRGTHWHPEIRQNGASGSFGDYPLHDPFSLARTVEYKPDGTVITIDFPNADSRLHLKRGLDGGFVGSWAVQRPERAFTLPAQAHSEPSSSKKDPDPKDLIDFAGMYRWASPYGDPIAVEVYDSPRGDRFFAEIGEGLAVKDLMRGRVVDDKLWLSYFDGHNAYLLVLAKHKAGTTNAQLWNGTWEHHELVLIAP